MDNKEILQTVDHTLLTQTATWAEIRQILDDGITYQTASACIPAAYVKQAVDYIVGYRQDEVGHPKPSSIIKLGKGGEVKIIRE